MTWIAAADPLALVAIQAGQISNPLKAAGAEGSSSLDREQRAVAIGEPVPIVFARWRNNKGGVLISPGATEARFENNTSNAVTAYYHLVLSEGEIDSIEVKDVFQRSCRVGSHSQTYSRRAGTWTPGNFIVKRSGYDKPECPYYCGSVGLYPGMSTMSFKSTVPNGFDFWNRQVHVFIRGGMHVTRLYDSTVGPSDNFADLVLWMLSNSGRVPSSLIDTTALATTATFLEVNGLTCNCYLTESRNYADLLARWAPYFLLAESSNNGKRGLRPLLPVNGDGTINTDAIDWEYIFTEDTILGDIEIQYSSLADRMPFVAQITWRQELDDDAAIMRTAEVRAAGTAETGPYESHDLSAFCTSEDHAVKVGAYIVAKRLYTTHTVRFSARPQAHNRILEPGDIVRVKLQRQASGDAASSHDYLYQVERVTKTLAGEVSYECTHFPIDNQGRSIVALAVSSVQGTGVLLTSNRSGISCDTNSGTDSTVPDEEFIEPGDENDPAPGGGGGGGYDFIVESTDGNGSITDMGINNAGSGLTDGSFDGIPATGGSGTGAGFGVSIDGGSVTDFTLDDGGSGYQTGDIIGPGVSDAGSDNSSTGGSQTTVPSFTSGDSGSSGGGGSTGSPGDGGGSGPNDDSENPDDDKDPSPDSPYDSWPDGYPTPNDPEWPEDWNPDPESGYPYFAPVSPSGDWPPPAWNGTYEYRYNKNIVALRYNFPCDGGLFVQATDVATSAWGTKQPVGFYFEYGALGLCGGNTPVRIWVLWHDDTSAIIFSTAGASGIQLQTAEVSVEYRSI